MCVAKGLLEKAGKEEVKRLEETNAGLKGGLAGMVRGWQESAAEEVRMVCLEWRRTKKGLYGEVLREVKKESHSTR